MRSSRRCCSWRPARSLSACTTSRTCARWAASQYMPGHCRHLLDRGAGAHRHAVFLRLLFQGCHHRGGRRIAPLGRNLRLLVRTVRVFVTALYTFRMLFMTFHGPERFRSRAPEAHDHAEATHRLRMPTDMAGIRTRLPGSCAATDRTRHPLASDRRPEVGPVLFGDYFGDSIFVLPANNVLGKVGEELIGGDALRCRDFCRAPFTFALSGVVAAWVFFLWRPQLADVAARRFVLLRRLLTQQVLLRLVQRARRRGADAGHRRGSVEGGRSGC